LISSFPFDWLPTRQSTATFATDRLQSTIKQAVIMIAGCALKKGIDWKNQGFAHATSLCLLPISTSPVSAQGQESQALGL
jgi:hypothetical protein